MAATRLERLSVAVGRSRLWWYWCASIASGQGMEARYRFIQQVSTHYSTNRLLVKLV